MLMYVFWVKFSDIYVLLEIPILFTICTWTDMNKV